MSNTPIFSSSAANSPKSDLNPIDHVVFVVHGISKLSIYSKGMGNQFEGMGKFEQNLSQLRKTCRAVIREDFNDSLKIEWIPIEWHSLLHQLDTADARMKKVTLPTCSILRMVNNDIMADVLYYFTSFHGQQIIDIVTSSINTAYASFLEKYPNFSGNVAIFGHSLGGIIVYDILANQDLGKSDINDNISSNTGIQYKKLLFKPSHFFAIGSPIAAVLIMRGQEINSYKIPKPTKFFNIFHLYDPFAYRIEPLVHDKFVEISPVLLERPSSKTYSLFRFSYYREQVSSYMSAMSASSSAQLPILSSIMSSSIALPTIRGLPGLAQAKETLNRQFTSMIDSISTASSFFESKNHKRKRTNDEVDSDLNSLQKPSQSEHGHLRIIKQPVSQKRSKSPNRPLPKKEPCDNISAENEPKGSSFVGIYASIISESVHGSVTQISTMIERVVQSIKGGGPIPPQLIEKKSECSEILDVEQSHESNHSNYSTLGMEERIDYFVQENVIENSVHQYLVGLQSHFSYWWDKDIHYFIVKNLEDKNI